MERVGTRDMEGKVTRVRSERARAVNEFQIVEDLQATLAQLTLSHPALSPSRVSHLCRGFPARPFAEIANDSKC